MSQFRQLSESVWVSPQISADDVKEAARAGFTLIVNNRPEGEAEDQTPGPAIAEAARKAGLDYIEIPISHAGFSEAQVSAMVSALQSAGGPVLAYCRSGTRSTLLWALARASLGDDLAAIDHLARQAGYDISPIAPVLEQLSARSAS